MDTDIGSTVRWILLDCKLAGIEVELDGENLLVRGNQERADLYAHIKDKKDEIVQAMLNLPDAVETHYLSRLRHGREWMDECMKRLDHDINNEKLTQTLVSNLMKWAFIDDEMRRLYPEFRGCSLAVVGGCDRSYAPVRCVYCAEKAKEKNDNQT